MGSFVAIVGASGSGKTTLLRALAGLITPASGVVRVGDADVTGHPDRRRCMVFQDDRLFPWRTAEANVTFGLEILGVPKAERLARARDALRTVGLSGHMSMYPSELSGGMRQRVNLARALVLSPQFLLMDEPFAALDAQTRELMQRELLRILDTTNVGVVFITHQIEEALYLADTVMVLAGRPATPRRVIEVPFDRPRDLEIKRLPAFQDLNDQVWHDIEEDVERALGEERDRSA
jgi:NitT/TauT family transport system ATP-binding protein